MSVIERESRIECMGIKPNKNCMHWEHVTAMTTAVVVVRFVVDKSNSKSKLKCRVERKRGIDRKREPVIGKC